VLAVALALELVFVLELLELAMVVILPVTDSLLSVGAVNIKVLGVGTRIEAVGEFG